MTLQEFLKATAEVDDRALRPALVLALRWEVPRSRESFGRFYRRVIDSLIESDVRLSGYAAVPVGARTIESRRTHAAAEKVPA